MSDHTFYIEDDQPAFLADSAPARIWPEVGRNEQQLHDHVDHVD